MTMARKILIALTAGVLALGAAACNAVKGAGEDIESVGEAGDRAI
jgi:predicted small secreted protein